MRTLRRAESERSLREASESERSLKEIGRNRCSGKGSFSKKGLRDLSAQKKFEWENFERGDSE